MNIKGLISSLEIVRLTQHFEYATDMSSEEIDRLIIRGANDAYSDISKRLLPYMQGLLATDVHHTSDGSDAWLHYTAVGVDMIPLLEMFEQNIDRFPEMPKAEDYIESICHPNGYRDKATFGEFENLYARHKDKIITEVNLSCKEPDWFFVTRWAEALVPFYAFCNGINIKGLQKEMEDYVMEWCS